MRYFADSILCNMSTQPIRRHLYSGMFKDLLDMKKENLKKDDIHKFYF